MNTTLDFSCHLTPGQDIDCYQRVIQKIPILTSEEEQLLTHRLFYEGDVEAARTLVIHHLRFVAHIAKSYSGYGLHQSDIIQEGNVGLMKAVKKFEPKHGVKLVTYAVHFVKAEIHEFVLRNWKVVRLATTKSQRKLFFNLRKAEKKGVWLTKAESEVVADKYNVPLKDVNEMEIRLKGHDLPYGGDQDDDSETNAYNTPENYLTNAQDNPETQMEIEDSKTEHKKLMDKFSKSLELLDKRSKDIVISRNVSENKATLHELSAIYGVSAERIRQLEKNALNKVKTYMTG